MNTVKVFLIGSIVLISYYLLLQWPPKADSTELEVQIDETKKEKPYRGSTDNQTNKISTLDDSKDTLTPLVDMTDSVESSRAGLLEGDDLEEIFYIENDVLKIGIQANTGRFISSEMKKIKNTKDGKSSLNIFGNRSLKNLDGCAINEGAIEVEGFCYGNYYANSGFFSEAGYLFPNFGSIEKTSLSDKKDLYVLSGEGEGFSFVRKILISQGEYSFSVEELVGLASGFTKAEQLVPYVEIVRDSLETGLDESRFSAYSYMGPVFSTKEDTFLKLDFSEISENSFQEDSLGGWFALIQRYFISAWIPDVDGTYKFQARKTSQNNYSLALAGKSKEVGVGSPVNFKTKLYVGPKITEELNKLNPDLGLVVDYGFLWWLGQPMYWLLGLGFKLLGNWGFAILFATVVIRAFLWPLTAASYRSMAKMRSVAPKIQELQSKYGSDKAKLGQETLALYKKEGVNPAGGCLPMILQMPFFLAFYWVLLDMVQLRHAPFVLWIDDLAAKDPYYFLPLINGALMYLSQKFMPITPSSDPTQQQMQQMMKYMPVGICLIFAWFPSGFVLYFTAQTLVQVIQQALNFRKEGVTVSSVLFK